MGWDRPAPAAGVKKCGASMHALLITFRSAASPDELKDGNTEYAKALRDGAAPGLVAKTWLADGATLGGFCLFEDRAAAERYLEGLFTEAVAKDPMFSDIRVEHYDVDEALSAITNGLGAVAVSRRV